MKLANIRIFILLVLALVIFVGEQADATEAVHQGKPTTPKGFDRDLRELPKSEKWKPGDPEREVPLIETAPKDVNQGENVQWNLKRTLKLAKTPLDTAVSLSGRYLFVLTTQKNILVYSVDGSLKGEFTVGKEIDGISLGPWEDVLFLTSRKNRTVQVIDLDFIQQISTSGSPSKGPAEAPIVVVVFGDFQ